MIVIVGLFALTALCCWFVFRAWRSRPVGESGHSASPQRAQDRYWPRLQIAALCSALLGWVLGHGAPLPTKSADGLNGLNRQAALLGDLAGGAAWHATVSTIIVFVVFAIVALRKSGRIGLTAFAAIFAAAIAGALVAELHLL